MQNFSGSRIWRFEFSPRVSSGHGIHSLTDTSSFSGGKVLRSASPAVAPRGKASNIFTPKKIFLFTRFARLLLSSSAERKRHEKN